MIKSGRIEVWHKAFGCQIFDVDEIHIIDDLERIGVCVHKHDIYIYKKDVTKLVQAKNEYIVESNTQKIKIIFKST